MTASTGSPAGRARLRLTDQALLAVTMARASAGDGRATVAHLLAGLLTEPDGQAGVALRRAVGVAAHRLAGHPGLAAPGLPPLEAALLATPAWPRPLWTADLLAGIVRSGGSDLGDLGEDLGIDLDDLARVVPAPGPRLAVPEDMAEAGQPHETRGLGTLAADGAESEADRVVALARARGGALTDLLLVLPDAGAELVAAAARRSTGTVEDVVQLTAARARSGDRTGALTTDDLTDAALAVLLAA